jgi:hypothetical protein
MRLPSANLADGPETSSRNRLFRLGSRRFSPRVVRGAWRDEKFHVVFFYSLDGRSLPRRQMRAVWGVSLLSRG